MRGDRSCRECLKDKARAVRLCFNYRIAQSELDAAMKEATNRMVYEMRQTALQGYVEEGRGAEATQYVRGRYDRETLRLCGS